MIFPVTLGQDFLKFRISKNSVLEDQDFLSKNRKYHQIFFHGDASRTPSLRGSTPLPYLDRAGPLFAGVLAHPDPALIADRSY